MNAPIPRGLTILFLSVASWLVLILAILGVVFLITNLVLPAFAAPSCSELTGSYYQPPPCPGKVCSMYGPGGCIRDWKLAAQLDVLKGKTIAVPARLCASACVLAVGTALDLGGHVSIAHGAIFLWPHERSKLDAEPMPAWFRHKVVFQ